MTVTRARINIARLMPPELPQFIDPLRLVKQGAQLSGSIKINDLPRLRAAVPGSDGALDFSLEFGRDDSGQACIIGRLAGQVEMTCQRCLQPLPVTIESSIALGVVQGDDEAGRLAAEYEPLLVSGQPLKLNELIEDEALLALPFAPLHDGSQCQAVSAVDGDAEATANGAPTSRPLAEQLAALGQNSDKH